MSNFKSDKTNYQNEISERLKFALQHGEIVKDKDGNDTLRLPHHTRARLQSKQTRQGDAGEGEND